MYLLRAQGERGAGYGRRQAQAADDLLPQLLGNDRDDPAPLHDQFVKGVQVQHALGHDGQTADRRSCSVKNRTRYNRLVNENPETSAAGHERNAGRQAIPSVRETLAEPLGRRTRSENPNRVLFARDRLSPHRCIARFFVEFNLHVRRWKSPNVVVLHNPCTYIHIYICFS